MQDSWHDHCLTTYYRTTAADSMITYCNESGHIRNMLQPIASLNRVHLILTYIVHRPVHLYRKIYIVKYTI